MRQAYFEVGQDVIVMHEWVVGTVVGRHTPTSMDTLYQVDIKGHAMWYHADELIPHPLPKA